MRAVVTSFALAVAVLAGCGDKGLQTKDERLPKDQYLSALAVVADGLQAAGVTCIDSNFTPSDCDEIPAALDEASATVGSIRPPLDVDDLHAGLVLGLSEAADDYRELNAIVKASEGLDPLEAIVKLGEVRESRRLESAARQFNERGYRLPAFLSGS